jgi:hypothetical protein
VTANETVTAVEGTGGPGDEEADGRTPEDAGVKIGVFLGVARQKYCNMHPHGPQEANEHPSVADFIFPTDMNRNYF